MAETETDKVFTVRRSSRIFRVVRWMHENPLWVNSESVGLEGILKESKKPQVSYIKRGIFALLVFYPLLVPFLFPSYIFFAILEIWGPLKRYDAQQTSLILGLFSSSAILTYKATLGGMVYGWFGNETPILLKIIQTFAVIADLVSAIVLIILCIELIALLVRKCRMIAGRTSVQFRG